MASKKIFWENLSVLAGGLFILTAAFFLSPDPRGFGTHEHLHLPPCFFRWITNLPCPSCGLTTSFATLAKGEFLQGFAAHPMGPFLFAAVLGFTIYALSSLIRNKSVWDLFDRPASLFLSGLWIAGLMITWILRLVEEQHHHFVFRTFF